MLHAQHTLCEWHRCGAVQEEVCPRLGIERHTTRALLAWAHLRQYLQQGDERMLARTRDLLREAPGAPADGVNASQQAAARSAIHAELKQRAGDMFELCTAEQAPLVLHVVQLSAPTQEQQADAARELYLSSVDAELARCWASSAGLPGALASDGGAHVGNSGGAAPQRPRAEATRLYMMTVKVRADAPGLQLPRTPRHHCKSGTGRRARISAQRRYACGDQRSLEFC